jgi:hypothetical protein
MTLQETAQILGGVGVIASIVYVGIQIRNNARALRAATYQQLSVISLQGWHMMAHNGETTGIMLRGMDDFSALNRVEKARFALSSWPMSRALRMPTFSTRSAHCAKVTGRPALPIYTRSFQHQAHTRLGHW